MSDERVSTGVASMLPAVLSGGGKWTEDDILAAVDELVEVEETAVLVATVEQRLLSSFGALAAAQRKAKRGSDSGLYYERRILLAEAWDTCEIAWARLEGPIDRLMEAVDALGNIGRRINEVN